MNKLAEIVLLKGKSFVKGTSILRGFPVILIVYISPLFAQQRIDSSITTEQILALPEGEIDVGLADLVLARDFYANLKIEQFLVIFDYMANRFDHFFGHHTDPDQRVRALNTFLYRKGVWNDSITFGFDEDDLQVTKLSNKFINGYLATKRGSCITLPMMYVILAERLGFPIFASRLPYHFFVRYNPEKKLTRFHENIEATNGGAYTSNKQYQKDFLVPNKAIKNGVYLRTLTKKEYVASLLLINSNEWIARKNLDKARYYLELSMKYDSTFSSAFMNYATIHLQEAIELERKMDDEKQSEIAFYDIYAKNMARNQTSPSPQFPGSLQHMFKIPEPDFSAFQIHIEDNLTKMNTSKQNQPLPEPTPPALLSVNPELQMSLAEITSRYVLLIQKKLAVYKRYKERAEELGIVRDYPMSFFQVQSNSLKQFQEKGVK